MSDCISWSSHSPQSVSTHSPVVESVRAVVAALIDGTLIDLLAAAVTLHEVIGVLAVVAERNLPVHGLFPAAAAHQGREGRHGGRLAQGLLVAGEDLRGDLDAVQGVALAELLRGVFRERGWTSSRRARPDRSRTSWSLPKTGDGLRTPGRRWAR